jgi:anti-sigma-K factor RskA
MNGDRHISQEDLGLHAMQALSSEESAAVRLHLAECAQCSNELADAYGDLAFVAMSVEQHAVSEGARQRFIDHISAGSIRERGPADARVIPIDAPRSTHKTSVWVPWAAVAALLVLSITLGMKNQSLSRELRQQSTVAALQTASSEHAQEVLDVLTAPAAQRVTLTAAKTHPAPTARAVYVASRGALILQASNLEPLPENKTYELWVIPANGSAPVPAGLFRPDAAGSASLVLPQLPKGIAAKAFGVTIEKASGSDTPTAPIVLSGAAPATGE